MSGPQGCCACRREERHLACSPPGRAELQIGNGGGRNSGGRPVASQERMHGGATGVIRARGRSACAAGPFRRDSGSCKRGRRCHGGNPDDVQPCMCGGHPAGDARRSGAGRLAGGTGDRELRLCPCAGAREPAQRRCGRRGGARPARFHGDATREHRPGRIAPGAQGVPAQGVGGGDCGGVLCRARHRGEQAELPRPGGRPPSDRRGRGVRDGAAGIS